MRRLCVLLTSSVPLGPGLLRVMSFCLVLLRARRLGMTRFLMLRGANLLRTRRFRPALFYARLFYTTRFHCSAMFSARLFYTTSFRRSALLRARLFHTKRFHRAVLFYARLLQPSLRLTRTLLARRLV